MSIADPAAVPDPASEVRAATPPPPIQLGRAVTRGAGIGLAATIINRVLSLVTQFSLARLLTHDDFGLVGEANVLAVLTAFFTLAGIQEVVTQRHQHYHRWAPAAFWLSVAGGLFTSALLLALAPVGAWFYGDHRIVLIVAIYAAGLLPASMQSVFMARLEIDMRFRAVAMTTICQFVTQTIVSIGLAYLGLGAAAVATGGTAASFTVLFLLVYYVPFRPGWRVRIRRWKYLIVDIGWMYVGRSAFALAAVMDSAVLGWLCTTEVVGRYYFSMNLAMQPPRMIYTALQNVLLPSLSKITHEPSRQLDAFLRGAELIAIIVVPVVAIQIVLARPFILCVFGVKWADTILTFRILSFAGAVYSVGLLNSGLVLAKRRNAAWCWQQVFNVLVMLSVIPAAKYFSDVGVATAVCVAQVLVAVSFHLIAIHGRYAEFGGKVVRLYVTSYAIGLACATLCWGVDRFGVQSWTSSNGLRLAFGAAAFVVYYPALLRLMTPGLFAELKHRITLVARPATAATRPTAA